MPEAHVYAYGQMLRSAALEAVGLFWIAAELAILFFMLAARRHIQSRPLPEQFVLDRKEKVRALGWTLLLAAVAAVVLGRHVLHAMGPVPGEVTPLLAARVRQHLAVWSGFVTVWVGLEVAIVYQGFRGYRALRKLLGEVEPTMKPAGEKIALLIFGAALLAQGAAYAEGLMAAVRAENQIYHNAMYLYLRLAGIVWIAAEWVAAAILWRSYVLFSAVARKVSDDD